MAKTGWTGSATELLRAGDGFRLDGVDTSSTPGFSGDKALGRDVLARRASELQDLQEKLFASSREGDTRSLLVVLQAMDTAGKGGIVKHTMSGADPQGLKLHAFKAPTDEERKHDFLWRIRPQLPEAGLIGVFDRSHYEDVLIHRVLGLSTPEAIEERYGIIRDFEAGLVAAGTTIVKVMLHISADEQRDRLEARLDDPTKQWKFNPGDLDSRADWPAYQEAYQLAIANTSTTDAPWFVVPADRKWYARIAVQAIVIDALESLSLDWPKPDYDVAEQKARLAALSTP